MIGHGYLIVAGVAYTAGVATIPAGRVVIQAAVGRLLALYNKVAKR